MGIEAHGLWNDEPLRPKLASPHPWTGAPGSPQPTWAENGFFKCFHSTREGALAHNGNLFAREAVALEGATPRLFRPMYAGATRISCAWLHPCLRVRLSVGKAA